MEQGRNLLFESCVRFASVYYFKELGRNLLLCYLAHGRGETENHLSARFFALSLHHRVSAPQYLSAPVTSKVSEAGRGEGLARAKTGAGARSGGDRGLQRGAHLALSALGRELRLEEHLQIARRSRQIAQRSRQIARRSRPMCRESGGQERERTRDRSRRIS